MSDLYPTILAQPEQVPPKANHVPPETPIQKALAEIFAEVVGVEKVGIHDDFFKLGDLNVCDN